MLLVQRHTGVDTRDVATSERMMRDEGGVDVLTKGVGGAIVQQTPKSAHIKGGLKQLLKGREEEHSREPGVPVTSRRRGGSSLTVPGGFPDFPDFPDSDRITALANREMGDLDVPSPDSLGVQCQQRYQQKAGCTCVK